MSRELITVATFANAAQASPACALLEENGVPVYMQGEMIADTLWHVGTALGGVKLQVAEEDVDRARSCLSQFAAEDEPSRVDAWDCPKCGARVDAGFEVCWSCGASFGEFNLPAGDEIANAPTDEDGSTVSEPIKLCPMCGQTLQADAVECWYCGERLTSQETDDTPPPISDSRKEAEVPEHLQEVEEIVSRAFRASIIGIGLCPPLLHLYSMLQLTEYQRLRREYQLESDWRARMAFIVNGISILVAAVILIQVYLGVY